MSRYFKASDAAHFSFFRVPKELITNSRYAYLPVEAKFLYGLMLDRMDLSLKNDWLDDNGNVYIYFAVKTIQAQLHCSKGKALSLLAALDSDTEYPLIKRVKQGLGKPNKIYLYDFHCENSNS